MEISDYSKHCYETNKEKEERVDHLILSEGGAGSGMSDEMKLDFKGACVCVCGVFAVIEVNTSNEARQGLMIYVCGGWGGDAMRTAFWSGWG